MRQERWFSNSVYKATELCALYGVTNALEEAIAKKALGACCFWQKVIDTLETIRDGAIEILDADGHEAQIYASSLKTRLIDYRGALMIYTVTQAEFWKYFQKHIEQFMASAHTEVSGEINK